MSAPASINNIQSLVDTLQKARDAYYNGQQPVMPDSRYDALEDELRKLAPTHPFLAKVGAPAPNGGWSKVTHSVPMLSLNKAQTSDDLTDWIRSIGVTARHTSAFVWMDKLDGLSIALKYENRKLVQALTRGDGSVGEDITRNVLLMQGAVKMLPPTIPNGSMPIPTPNTVWVRGEIVCKKSDFVAHFPGESNTRNTASGTAKRQTGHEKAKHLTIVAYRLMPGGITLAYTESELDALKGMGFWTPCYGNAPSLAELEAVYQRYVTKDRAALDYDIDGLVIEVNHAGDRENLGDLNGRPKGAVAYKFPHDQKPTTLRNIRWQVGNSGRVTPVAEFDPVNLAGANVSQASLHNISNIRSLAEDKKTAHFAVGDRILVARRNDVIPYVEELLVPHPTGTILTTPTDCPSCKATLERDGEYLVCRNLDCEAQASGAVKRWIQKVGILHLGDTVVEAMIENGLIVDAADLYTVDPDSVASLYLGGRKVGGMADRGFTNLKAKMTLPLHVIVGSIGIPMIGRTMAKTIADGGFNSLSKMYKATIPQIAAIPGVGDVKARAFVEGFHKRVGLLGKLIANGVVVQNVSGHLVGKVFCPTGFRDASMREAIEKVGGTFKDSLSKGVTYLIVKDPSATSEKTKKAASWGTTVIGIDEAWDIINGKV